MESVGEGGHREVMYSDESRNRHGAVPTEHLPLPSEPHYYCQISQDNEKLVCAVGRFD